MSISGGAGSSEGTAPTFGSRGELVPAVAAVHARWCWSRRRPGTGTGIPGATFRIELALTPSRIVLDRYGRWHVHPATRSPLFEGENFPFSWHQSALAVLRFDPVLFYT